MPEATDLLRRLQGSPAIGTAVNYTWPATLRCAQIRRYLPGTRVLLDVSGLVVSDPVGFKPAPAPDFGHARIFFPIMFQTESILKRNQRTCIINYPMSWIILRHVSPIQRLPE